MQFGICPQSVVPIRSTSSHKAEMVSQLLFGEVFQILKRKDKEWLQICCYWDEVVGYVSTQEIRFINEREFEQLKAEHSYSLEIFEAVMGATTFQAIPLGAQLPHFDGLRLKIGPDYFTFSGQAVYSENIRDPINFLKKVARRYLNVPFLWGGRSTFGIDAPGLTQMIYMITGNYLPRTADQQVYFGESIDFIEQTLPGDLAFFENNHGRINHVGLIWENNTILHAYGRVRVDKVDHFGIFNEEIGTYTHRLRIVKRIYAHLAPEQAVYLSDQDIALLKRTLSSTLDSSLD